MYKVITYENYFFFFYKLFLKSIEIEFLKI